MPFKVSDESINSYGIRILSNGGDFTLFNNNPLMLYAHDDYSRLPIGTWINLTVHENKDITADPVFDEEDPFASEVKRKVDKKIIRMASIGIIPLEWSDDDNLKHPGQVGVTITKWLLREISICPFGSNRNAFKMYDIQGNEIKLSELTTFFNSNNSIKMSDTKNSTLKTTLAAGLNLSDSLSDAELIREVLKLYQENTVLKQQNQQLVNEKEQQTQSLELTQKEQIINNAVAGKKITEKQKPAYMKMELSDLKTIFEGMPAPVNLGELGNPIPEQEKGRETWTFAEWSKNDSEGLKQMKLTDKPRYMELFKKQYRMYPKNI